MASRPNFFIAARIINESTVSNLKEVSDHIKNKDELLGECCTSLEKLHLTFSVLKLDSQDDILNASRALQTLAEKDLPPVTLNLEGLGHFRRRVLYSSITENAPFLELRQNLVEELESRMVVVTDKSRYTPHITIAKLSRRMNKLRQSKIIEKELYLQFAENGFGEQKINHLFLCHIGGESRDDGFYRCAFEVPLPSE